MDSRRALIEELKSIARKWLEKWRRARVYEADADPSRPKFFITAAFMYPNSPAHAGHARTYLVADVLARFKRLRGFNALFPMGFHYTGTPIVAMAERVASGDEAFKKVLVERFDVPPELVEKMSDPLFMARYFHEVSKKSFDEYGLSIDWRREFTTIDPEFQRFIQWQFRKLYSMGFIEQGTHPVGWCPRHQMPVGAHDTKDDVEPDIGEFVAIHFVDDEGLVYPTATLRPETVFGVTNLWVNPVAEYAIVEVDGSRMVVGRAAADRLSYQMKIRILSTVPGSSLVGKRVRNPVTGEEVPVLPATFVDPSFATGVVMSVPAHAPYDAAALLDLKRGLLELPPELKKVVEGMEPRKIIEVEGLEGVPAIEALRRYGVETQNDRSKLDEATKFVYSLEASRGFMVRDLSRRVPIVEELRELVAESIDGKPVAEARENIRRALLERRLARIVYELINKPVYCRCGTEIVVKLLENQWFLNYGHPRWKELALELLNSMKIVPEEARAQFKATIDWLRKRACARTRGLGVPLPWDPTWIIESLSDSTIYMAFYTVIHKIRSLKIPPEKLVDEFWDYVLLGKGDPKEVGRRLGIDPRHLEEIRREFDYWYPLDWRVSGKDLIPSHLTFFIFNHAAIFPREKWPRGIIANGWVLRGGKMSKSRGNVVLLKDLVDGWGPDAARLAMAMGAEVPQDFELTDDLLDDAVNAISRIVALIERLAKSSSDRECRTILDRWALSEMYSAFEAVARDLDSIRLRSAAVRAFHGVANVLERYLANVDTPCREVVEAVRDWIKVLSPFTPFIAEELWHRMGGEGFVVVSEWPKPRALDYGAMLAMRLAESVIEDVRNIARATKRERVEKVIIYAYPSSVYEALRLAMRGGSVKEVGNKLLEAGVPRERAYTLAQRVIKLVREISEDLRKLVERASIDEVEALRSLSSYISKSLGGAEVTVLNALDPSAPDYKGKKGVALPLKPGIYVE